MEIMFEIPSIEGNKRVVITKEVVEKAQKPEIETKTQKSA
jgi:ATP-dependent Clp protease ATP-binding subunit ClpX